MSSPTGPAAPTDGPEVRVRGAADPAAIRRAPRLGPFVVTGVLLGALAAFAGTYLGGGTALPRADLFWLVFLSTGLFGGLLGALVFLAVDRRSLRRRDAALSAALDAARDAGTARP